MKRVAALILFLLASLALCVGRAEPSLTRFAATAPAVPSPGSFIAVQVFINPHGKPLACYQLQVVATTGDAKLVGIEGGDAAAFEDAPYYDPRALNGNRIIFGAYSLGSDLPAAQTRVATLMFRVGDSVEPHFQATLDVAATSDASSIPATVSLVVGSSGANAQKNLAAAPARPLLSAVPSVTLSLPRSGND